MASNWEGEEGEGLKKGAGFFVLGISLTIVSAVMTNVSQVLQKRAHQKMMLLPAMEHKPYVKQPVWLIGFFLFCVAQAVQFVAVGFTPESVVAPLGSLTLVSNAIFAAFLLREAFTVADLVGTLFVIAGSVLAVVYGPHTSQSAADNTTRIDVPQLLALAEKPVFVISISIFSAFSALLLVSLHLLRCSFRVRKRSVEGGEKGRGKGGGKEGKAKKGKGGKNKGKEESKIGGGDVERSGDGGGVDDDDDDGVVVESKSNCLYSKHYYWPLLSEIMDVREKEGVNPKRSVAMRKRASHLFQFAYPYLAGAMSAMTLLISKCLSSLLITSVEGDSQFAYFLPYALFILLVLVCAFTMHWLNMGLKYFDVRFVVPTYQLFYIVLSIIMGEVYWGDFSSFQSITQMILFPAAIVLALVGIIFLSLSPVRTTGDEEMVHQLKRAPTKSILTKTLNKKWMRGEGEGKDNNDANVSMKSGGVGEGEGEGQTKIENEKSPLLSSAPSTPSLYPSVPTQQQ